MGPGFGPGPKKKGVGPGPLNAGALVQAPKEGIEVRIVMYI